MYSTLELSGAPYHQCPPVTRRSSHPIVMPLVGGRTTEWGGVWEGTEANWWPLIAE